MVVMKSSNCLVELNEHKGKLERIAKSGKEKRNVFIDLTFVGSIAMVHL